MIRSDNQNCGYGQDQKGKTNERRGFLQPVGQITSNNVGGGKHETAKGNDKTCGLQGESLLVNKQTGEPKR